jgi:hypothetical protein
MSKKDDVAGIPAKIARAIEQAEVIRMENPDDLNDEGVVVGYAKPMTRAERAATLAGATEGLLESAWQGEEGSRFVDFFSDDLITAQVRAEMMTLCVDLLMGVPEEEGEMIRNNIVQRERIENLKEWLDKGGWQKVEADRLAISRELERCFQGVPQDIVAREYPPVQGGQGISIEQRIVRLAGKKSAPIQGKPSVSMTGEPLEYFDALRYCFNAKNWPMLLRTAQTDEAGEGVFDQFAWLRLLVRPYVEAEIERIRREDEYRQTATPLDTRRAIIVGEREFIRLPKFAAPMSWAFGGSFIEIDGHQFMPMSELPIAKDSHRVAVPAGFALLPKDYKKPHQMILPLDLTGDEIASDPLPMAIASAGQHAISFRASLLAIDVMGMVMSNLGLEPVKTSLRELTERGYPDAPKLKRFHYESTAKHLAEINVMYLFLPDGRSYKVFDTMVPWRDFSSDHYDMKFSVGLSRTFTKDVMQDIGEIAGKSFRGHFIADRTGLWKCSGGSALRSYLRACSWWNSSYKKLKGRTEPAPELMRPIPMEEWVMLTNHLTPAAEEYIQTRRREGGGRQRLHEAIKTAKDAAEELHEKGMAKIKVCNSKEILLLPTDLHLEAWWAGRNAQDRMSG